MKMPYPIKVALISFAVYALIVVGFCALASAETYPMTTIVVYDGWIECV